MIVPMYKPHRGSSKVYFLDRLFKTGILTPTSNILDMGSGTSNCWTDILKENPSITYTGIEPYTPSYEKAFADFGELPNVTIHKEFAYQNIAGFGKFDICFSLSVLEHVKNLPLMLAKSVESVKSGGHIFHWYDLGHALHPSSLKEKVHVFIGNNLPFLLTETNFVQYLDPQKAADLLTKAGSEVQSISYHQTPVLKKLLKVASSDEEYVRVTELAEWEYKNQDLIQKIEKNTREKMYPAIVIHAIKK